MSFNGWKTADSDMHIMEPADLWETAYGRFLRSLVSGGLLG